MATRLHRAGLRIDPVVDAEALQTWCDVLATAFTMPNFARRAFFNLFSIDGFESRSPLRHFIGWLDGKPVATATLFLAAGVAGIYNVATVRDARYRGIGAAMTSRALGDARAQRYRVGILQSSVMGAAVYLKLGFREYCKIGLYVWLGENSGGCARGPDRAANQAELPPSNSAFGPLIPHQSREAPGLSKSATSVVWARSTDNSGRCDSFRPDKFADTSR